MTERSPGHPEDFKPAVDVDELLSKPPVELPEDPLIRESQERGQAFMKNLEQGRDDMAKLGYSSVEIESTANNGYVMPEVYANELPSDAYLEHAASQEAKRDKVEVDHSAYESQRKQLQDTLASRGFSTNQVEQILNYGYLMPAEYSATPAADILAERRDAEPKAA